MIEEQVIALAWTVLMLLMILGAAVIGAAAAWSFWDANKYKGDE